MLLGAGFDEVDFGEPADCQVVNTCTVTREADRKSRQMIRRAQRLGPQVVATGCAVAQRGGLGKFGGAILKLPPDRREELLELIGAERCPASEELEEKLTATRARALLKVQDGCDQFCSFCIVPYVRGRSSSVSTQEVVDQARALEERGFQEIVLSGIHLAIWGHDLEGEPDLSHLVAAVLKGTQGVRVRLSSVEPDRFPLRLIDLLEEYPDRFCPHLHLVLQHASDPVLDRMRRGYDLATYRTIVERFLAADRRACLTSDIMVGFPGETEDDHRCLLDYLEETPFFHLHVFPYSLRPGTSAAKFPDQISAEVKKRRRDEVLQLAERKREDFLQAAVGQTYELLGERFEEGWVRGTTENYLPVKVKGGPPLVGRLARVVIEQVIDGGLRGTLSGEEFS